MEIRQVWTHLINSNRRSVYVSGHSQLIVYCLKMLCVCLGQGADLHMAQLMLLQLTISCSNKSRLVLPSWCQLTRVVLDKIQEGHKTVECVCVGVPKMYNPTLLAKNNRLVLLGVQHSDVLEVGTNIEIHNNDLPGEGEIFCLDVGRIIGNCHFSIALMGTLGLISPVRAGAAEAL